jgi:hypothetical protein
MNPCDVYSDWDELDHLGALDGLIQDALSEWGFDSVTVVNGEAPGGGAPGEYKDGTIYLDLDNEEWAEWFGDPFEAMTIAYHEAIHAMIEQAGFDFDTEDLFEANYMEEIFAASLGANAADEALEGCACEEALVSSIPVPVNGDAPPFPWVCDLD